MQKSKFNVLVDGGWGSSGKGLINSYLAWSKKPEVISCTNAPNAGHTAVHADGRKFVAKALPSSAVMHKWLQESAYIPEIVLGASAAFTLEQIEKEIQECSITDHGFAREPLITIHPRAGVITEEHKRRENDLKTGTKHVASTMQGCGAFLADKIMRKPGLKLASDYDELKSYMPDYLAQRYEYDDETIYLPEILIRLMMDGKTILHEGSQGFSLDINHGNQYPNCTSRGCTAMQMAADMGIPHSDIGDIYLVIRPYPIRVGNVSENGKIVGYSGDCYPDHYEVTWADIAKRAGAPEDIAKGENTTVTGRLRRVFSWSNTQASQAILVNGATKVALNFANYIDWGCYGKNQWDDLGDTVLDWIARFEDKFQIEVALVGTGPQIDHVCERE